MYELKYFTNGLWSVWLTTDDVQYIEEWFVKLEWLGYAHIEKISITKDDITKEYERPFPAKFVWEIPILIQKVIIEL